MIKRSECTCACHTPGSSMIHMFPCCEPDDDPTRWSDDGPTWDGEKWSDDNPITDEEKHAFCRRRWGVDAVFLPEPLYAAAELTGCFDMRRFVIDKPLFTFPIPPGNIYTRDGKLIGSIMTDEQAKNQYAKGPQTWAMLKGPMKQAVQDHASMLPSGVTMLSVGEYTLDEGKTWRTGEDLLKQINKSARKFRGKRCTFGIACMPGLNGKCTACAMDEQ